MAHLLNPTIEFIEQSPEVKSYIYQQITEFEPFITPDTVISVIARDPRKLMLQLETDGHFIEPEKLSKMFRIAIVLKEGDTHIQEEGLHDDIFEAIRLAKAKLIKRLVQIQDAVISNQDWQEQINHAVQGTQVH